MTLFAPFLSGVLVRNGHLECVKLLLPYTETCLDAVVQSRCGNFVRCSYSEAIVCSTVLMVLVSFAVLGLACSIEGIKGPVPQINFTLCVAQEVLNIVS